MRVTKALESVCLFFLVLLMTPSLWAREFSELYRGARSQAMGGAYVGLADDEQAIFLNPAGLAGNRRFTLQYMAADFSMSTDVITSYQAGLSAFQNLSGDSLNVVIGKNIYTQAQLVPTLLMPNLGVGIIVDGQAALLSQNKALPQLTVGYQTTNGVQVAYGIALGRGIRQRGSLQLGFGAKILWRRGGYRQIPLLTLLTISKDKITALMGGFERGIGLDVGAHYRYKMNSLMTFSAGLAFTDVGDTSFGSKADPVKSNLAAGMALSSNLRATAVNLTYDYRHILNQTDWRKKSHIGVELQVPMLSLYGGINQVSFSYGASYDLWLMKFTVLSYAEEQASFVHLDSMRRWVLKTSMKFNL